MEAIEEEPSTSGRPELEAPVAPAEVVQDVTEIVQAVTAAESVPARQQDSVRLRCCIFCAVSLIKTWLVSSVRLRAGCAI